MTALVRSAAKLFLLLQIPFVFACADTGPGGPGEPADARFAGLLTMSENGGADFGSGPAFRGAVALAGAQVDLLSGQGNEVATFRTGASGAFSASLPSGGYTVRIVMSEGPPLEFALDLPPGETLFAEGRVDQTSDGVFTLNVQVFRDGNADARPDDSFRVQVLDREQGDEESGFEDVVASEEEAKASVTLCHFPPGNPDAAHTVSVGAPAVAVHLAHGDTEGACADDAGDEEDPEDGAKVLVCHVPPGNPENPVTIEVAEASVPAHLAHGDTEGACAGDTVPGDDGEGSEEEPEDEEDDAGQPKVVICHVPPGNPEHPHTIEVAEPALPAHLAHGDTEGPCADDGVPADEESGEESEEVPEAEG